MATDKYRWDLYFDSKKNREPIPVSFDEWDNSVSLSVTRGIANILIAEDILDGETYLLNPAYKSMSNDELRSKLDELFYTDTVVQGTLSSLTNEEYKQARNLVRFLQITVDDPLSIRTKLKVQRDQTISGTDDGSGDNVWESSVKFEPKLTNYSDSLEYYIKLKNYHRKGFRSFQICEGR